MQPSGVEEENENNETWIKENQLKERKKDTHVEIIIHMTKLKARPDQNLGRELQCVPLFVFPISQDTPPFPPLTQQSDASRLLRISSTAASASTTSIPDFATPGTRTTARGPRARRRA